MALHQGYQFHNQGHGTQPPHLLRLVPCPPALRYTRSRIMDTQSDTAKQLTTRPLHFVNTDAETITTKGAARRTKDVKSHLSGDYRRWKKQQTLKAQTAKKEQQLTKAGVSPSGTVQGEPSEQVSPASWSSSSSQPQSRSETRSPPEARESSKGLVSLDKQWTATETAAIRNVLSHGNSDPFYALPLPVDPHTNMHIQLFFEGTTVICWKMNMDPRILTLVHNKALMHGVLAVSKVIAATYLPIPQKPDEMIPESQRHYGELLRLMRKHFDSQGTLNTDLSFEMMHAAMMFSFLAQQFEEFEFHMKSLRSLIDSKGGLRALDPYHITRYLAAERLRSLYLHKASLVPVEFWSPGSWYSTDKFRCWDALYEQGRTVMSLPDPPLLPKGPFLKRAQTLILDHRDMLAGGFAAATLFRTGKPGTQAIQPWLGMRSSALSTKLGELIGEINQMNSTSPSLELSLTAAACLSSNFIGSLIYFSSNPTVGLSYIPFTTLFQFLREIDGHVQQGLKLQYQHLYLWTLFVGSCAELASRTWSCDPSFRGSSWCSTNFARTIEKLRIRTLDELRTSLRYYVFPYMFEPYMKVLFYKRYELIKLATESLEDVQLPLVYMLGRKG